MTKKIIILFWVVLTPFFLFGQSGNSPTVEENETEAQRRWKPLLKMDFHESSLATVQRQ